MAKRDYKNYNILTEDIIANEEEKLSQAAINEITEYHAETKIIRAQDKEVLTLESAGSNEDTVSQMHDLGEYESQAKTETIQRGELNKEDKHQDAQLKRISLDKGQDERSDEKTENQRFKLLSKFKRKNKQTNNQEKSLDDNRQLEEKRKESTVFLHQSNKSDRQLEKASTKTQDEEKYLHFPAYKRYYQQKERSALFRWLMLFAKIIITLMLLPLIGFMAVAALCCVAAFGIAIVGCLGIGLIVIGTVAFMSTQISSSAIALGVSVGITTIAFGGVILVIFLMIMKGLRSIFKRYKRPHMKMGNKEEVK